MSPPALTLLIEEGRRQLDWQSAQLERLRTRASTLLTVSLAEIALLASGARASWHSHWFVAAAWTLSVLLIALGLAGTASVLTGKAITAEVNHADLASASPSTDLLERLATGYATAVPQGWPTLYTFVTIIRDAVMLLVVGAIIFAAVWPWR